MADGSVTMKLIRSGKSESITRILPHSWIFITVLKDSKVHNDCRTVRVRVHEAGEASRD